MTERRTDANSLSGLSGTVGKNFKGAGTYALDENTYLSAEYKDLTYESSWTDEDGNAQYGPGSITITQFNGAGKPVAGKITATLHYQDESSGQRVHKQIAVVATFKTSASE
jgi:hypothetical protein